ncbi:Plasmodium exported protein (PHISTa), unknown function [Plasmodium sp. gorilla clade G2]|uniref:Plasmodium exported protein (PHISTa), unknown function n=1 Tax=Plasmodium sp. gorilla clade G2 TaxID=880535 RepID=UPI000D208A22|nr:Plasmodium exported protein (PHISTa), unknown function [Plasmodium sp. gorilla clade G2]SOV11130.1 Plasmodium exported protein (PHISTa), unknown function [Plasmodium sp. gorilla clade G2]
MLRGSNMNNSKLEDSSKKMKKMYCSSYIKYICLTICVIGMLYIKYTNKYGIHSSSDIQIHNVFLRILSESQEESHPSMRNTNSKENSKKSKVKNNKNTDNDDKKKLDNNQDKEEKKKKNNKSKTENTETTKNNKKSNLDYNNLNNRFTKEEMKNLIDSLNEIPPKQDEENIWKHALKTANSGTDKIANELMKLEKKHGKCSEERPNNSGRYEPVLIKQPDEFNERLKIHENDYTSKFNDLINREHTLDELKNFIGSFLEGFERLIEFLFHKYKIKFEQKDMKIPIVDTIYDRSKKDKNQKKGKKEKWQYL